MTAPCAAGVADFFVWLSATLGIVGSLLLIVPLFLLLRHREMLDDMAYGLEYDLLSAELAPRIRDARKAIAEKLHEQRFAWKPWVAAGAIALGLSLICALAQGWCLYASRIL
jgi:heme exporter protein D